MLIDLDSRPAAPSRAGRRAGARPLAVVATLLLLLLLLLSAGGAAARRQGGPVEVATTGDRATSAVLLTGDALYSAHSGGYLRATPLHPGGAQWNVRLPDAEQSTLLLHEPWLLAAGPTGDVTLLEPRTGRIRWRSPPGVTTWVLGGQTQGNEMRGGQMRGGRALDGRPPGDWAPDGRALGDRALDGPASGERVLDGRVVVVDADRLSVIDPVTGRTVWSRPVEVVALDAADGRLVVLDGRNRLTVHAAADGRVLAGPRDGAADNPAPAVRILRERVVLVGEDSLDVLRLDDLTWLWRRTTDGLIDLAGCANWWCLTGPGGLTVLDPATGAERWHGPGWRRVAGDDGIVSADDARTARLDLATGRVLRELGRGGVVDDLMLHAQPDRTLITRLADRRVLGEVPPVAVPGCARQGPYLGCPVAGGRFVVWRI